MGNRGKLSLQSRVEAWERTTVVGATVFMVPPTVMTVAVVAFTLTAGPTVPEAIALMLIIAVGLGAVAYRALILRKLIRERGPIRLVAAVTDPSVIYPFTPEWLKDSVPGAVTMIVSVAFVGVVGALGLSAQRPDYLFIWIPVGTVMLGMAAVNLVSLREERRRTETSGEKPRAGIEG